MRRIGEDTNRIKVGPGQFMERHESQLRAREPDVRGKHVYLDYTAHEANSDNDFAEEDNYTIEKKLAQCPNASAPGGLEFKVRWRGYGPSYDTLGARLFFCAADQHSPYGVYLQAVDKARGLSLRRSYPGD